MKVLNVLILLLFIFHQTTYSQIRPLTEAQRREQQQFIKHDTLPVQIQALPYSINSRFSEYAGQLFDDSIFYFTSMRADVEEDNDHIFETSWYCNIYKSKLTNDGDFTVPEALPTNINAINTFNSNFCFNKARNKIIYSRCKRNENGELQCTFWESILGAKGWNKARKLPNIINEDGSSCMHPFLLEMNDHQVLYFSSNRKNGFGGYDLWYSIIKNNEYGTPINLGSTINTEGNEVTPFYDSSRSILYFSSDEHLGIGDYDIFYSQGALSQWGEVANMGVPYNSEYNDYYFNMSPDGESGFFSSNRPHDGMALSDTCCNDIFHFKSIPQKEEEEHIEPASNIKEQFVAIFPIVLYFENDQPDPHTTSDTTVNNYLTLYQQYLQNHHLYIQESGHGLKGDSLQTIQKDMYQFLRDSVSVGYEKLQLLTQYLKEMLLKGEEIRLTVTGHASPLHNNAYNKHLSSRRIVSLLNYLYQTDNHFFEPYLRGEREGLQLHIKAEGAFEHGFSSDNKRETVYGIQAAKDRKIVISYEE